jgi:hypothetical protein
LVATGVSGLDVATTGSTTFTSVCCGGFGFLDTAKYPATMRRMMQS